MQRGTWTQDSHRGRQLEQWSLGIKSLDLDQKDPVSDILYYVPWTHFLTSLSLRFPYLRNTDSGKYLKGLW